MASLNDLANIVQNKKIEEEHNNIVVDEKVCAQLKKGNDIIKEAYTYFDKYMKGNKKFNFLPIIPLLILHAIATMFLQKYFGKSSMALVFMVILVVLVVAIFEIFIYRPHRLRIRDINQEAVKAIRLIMDNKSSLSIVDKKYWFPLSMDFIVSEAENNKGVFLKEILEKADKYIEENAVKVDKKNIKTTEVTKYNLYKIFEEGGRV